MKLLGLDFDNTLVQYDSLFYKLAREKDLVDSSIAPSKIAIRDYLRYINKEDEFTLLQGEVYGLRILEADPPIDMLRVLENIQKNGIKLAIISHKTQMPFKGPAYDLHAAAISWLEKYNFFANEGINIPRENVFFEPTKELKVKRIEDIQCTAYIDDLPEILEMINIKTLRIHYNPESKFTKQGIKTMTSWSELPEILKNESD